MAVFLLNECKFNNCGLCFKNLYDLIQHIEDKHIGKKPKTFSSLSAAVARVGERVSTSTTFLFSFSPRRPFSVPSRLTEIPTAAVTFPLPRTAPPSQPPVDLYDPIVHRFKFRSFPPHPLKKN